MMLPWSAASSGIKPGLSPLHKLLVHIPAGPAIRDVGGVLGFRFPFIAPAFWRFAHPSCQQSCQSVCYAARPGLGQTSEFSFCASLLHWVRGMPSQKEKSED